MTVSPRPSRDESFILEKDSSLRKLFDGLADLHDQFEELQKESFYGIPEDQGRRESTFLSDDDGLDALRRELEGICLPEYQEWQQEERSVESMPSKRPRSSISLPIVSKMADHEKINDVIAAREKTNGIRLAESSAAAMEMIKEDSEISENIGMTPDTMLNELGAVLSKYEVPMGLMNKLMMLSEFEVLKFMIDDAGSMALCDSNMRGSIKAPLSRWNEAQGRLKELLEILAYVPFHQITIEFLNRSTTISLERNGRNPAAFLADAIAQVDEEFAKPPAGTSLFLERLTQSLTESPGIKIARWYFGDGKPQGGDTAQEQIVNLVMNRDNPAGNPITFVSCTNVDDDVEWMKDLEEIAPFCSEYDDYQTEAGEVLRDQGMAMPYSKGFHLVGTLVAAINPDDLDAMDESVPFTKTTLDNLLGIQHTEEMYRHYFRCFQVAQSKRQVISDADRLKKSMKWDYDEFFTASGPSNIPSVQRYETELKQISAPSRADSFILEKDSSLRKLFDGLADLHDQFEELQKESFYGIPEDQVRRESTFLSDDDGLDTLRRELEGICLPEYQEWQQEERSVESMPSKRPRSSISLPIVSKMADHEKINDVIAARGKTNGIRLAESSAAAMEMIKEDSEISENIGMTPDTMLNELGAVLSKYEVPMGLMNKLMMLSEFEVLKFMIDDAGSMALCDSNMRGSIKAPLSRWNEAQGRLKELLEILAYVPFHQITIEFLNRSTTISLERNGRNPAAFLADAIAQVDEEFAKPPAGTSLFLERLTQSLTESPGIKIARWYFGDGKPQGGDTAQEQIVNLVMNRDNPAGNPITFVSCTNVDDDVEWMKDLEEIAPFCSEYDDYQTEAGEVLRDQGMAMPYSKGFHLVGTLVAAINPDDLDAMDESVPFTKTTLDNLLGIQHTEEMYRHYFRCFQVAQSKRQVISDADRLKKSMKWDYDEFFTASGPSNIPSVQRYETELKRITGY
ncbi:unnamed protein product [Cylindrotheca closterium]|uniref:Uncharacterized protein n=2 Tax=Cylindrotheca closterium TaxID=2856 RepID=A0AAD2PWD1_9STRA|nr:unnamed protein product [Cylindrotheca closterium]